MIIIIAAMDPNRVIGKNNKLPWHIPDDLKNFKELTSGNTIVMGRNTYESIGKPLPNRKNIVLSTTMKPIPGLDVCDSLEKGLEKAKSYGTDIFIVGGAKIYEQSLKFADKMILSFVKKEYEGDTYFPEFGEEWEIENTKDFPEFELVTYKNVD